MATFSTIHPLTAKDRTAMAVQRAAALPNKGKLRAADARARALFDAVIGSSSAPDGVTFSEDRIGSIRGWWCEPTGALANAAILHLHGGWFNFGSADAFRHFVGHIARRARVNAFIPDYPLAPEHPFPAAVRDAQVAFRGLIERGIRTIAICGDSAGGNLALGLLATASRSPQNDPAPIGAVLLSPVTDLAMTGSSWQSRADSDPYFVRDQVASLINAYLDGHDADDPAASPLYGNFAGLPPIRVHVGDDEVLLDDSLRCVERAVAAGVDARVDVWEGMPHGFMSAVGRLEAADNALTEIGAFLADRFSKSLGPP